MRIAGIIKDDMANGEGVRLSVFVSGCPIHCKGCQNEELWDPGYGEECTQEKIDEILKELEKPTYKGLSILGGEPLAYYNVEGVYNLVRQFRIKFQASRDLWVWTGYDYEKDLKNIFWNAKKEADKQYAAWTVNILNATQVLVDGPFIEDQKTTKLPFRGSTNQKIIEVHQR